METNILKSAIINKISHLQTEVTLENLDKLIDEMLDSEKNGDWWATLTQNQKNNIEISMGQIERGEVIGNEMVQAIAKTWLKKWLGRSLGLNVISKFLSF